MKLVFKTINILLLLIVTGFFSCKEKPEITREEVNLTAPDSLLISSFLKEFPEIKEFEQAYNEIYSHYNYRYIWVDEKGFGPFGESLYDRVKALEKDGIYSVFPYQQNVDSLHSASPESPEEILDAELLLTGLYVFYIRHVYKGIDSRITTDLGWLLPREELDDAAVLSTVISEPEDSLLIPPYYKLRKGLEFYKKIKDEGGWPAIEISSEKTVYKPLDSSEVIRQIRNRLYLSGEIKRNNSSAVYDEELQKGIYRFQKYHGFNRDSVISAKHLRALNTPVEEYIKKIVVNMERCRWIPPRFSSLEEAVLVNIPAFHLGYYRNGEIIFDSEVVVGSVMTKTVIFDGEMSYLAFSPYWNLPQSIIKNEVIPGMEKDEKYLEKRNMIWNNGQVRQLPGRNNSLGLVKFMFPNSNSIYLHDSPARSLFKSEDRARSHGCIRVAKARDLAVLILEDDENWSPEKIDAAMHAGKESTYSLKKKIPVYIGYFTVWPGKEGGLYFYEDVYKRDDRLADLLFYKAD